MGEWWDHNSMEDDMVSFKFTHVELIWCAPRNPKETAGGNKRYDEQLEVGCISKSGNLNGTKYPHASSTSIPPLIFVTAMT